MITTKINSNKIQKIEYDEDTKKMYITYKNSTVYVYLGITKDEYDKFVLSDIDKEINKFNEEHICIKAVQ